MSSSIMIKRDGNKFEVSNGTVTISGPDREQLLEIMDSLNGNPADVKTIEAKVKKAGENTRKKMKAKSGAKGKDGNKPTANALVRNFFEKNKGIHFTASDVAEGTGLTTRQAGVIMWRLWYHKELKSKEKGVYYK